MHFLKRDEAQHNRRASDLVQPWIRGWACATVKLIDAITLEVQPGEIGVLKADALLVLLPERMKVVDPDGRKIAPSKGRRFHVSTETFNPFHALTEIAES
jgi:hypothetical protein